MGKGACASRAHSHPEISGRFCILGLDEHIPFATRSLARSDWPYSEDTGCQDIGASLPRRVLL